MKAYHYRPAAKSDLAAMMKIGHEGLKPHVEKVRVWGQAAEEAGFIAHFEPEKIQIIQVDGRDAGYIKLERFEDHTYIEGIYISRQYRGMGYGTEVLRDLISTNTDALRLHVYRLNPARLLYLRLGFVEQQGDEHRVLMEYQSTAVDIG